MHCYINRDRTVQGVLDPEEYAGALRQLVLGNKEPFLDLITNAADCLLEVLDIPFKFVTGQPKVAIYPDHVVVELKLSDDYKLPEIPDDNPAGMRQSVFKFSSMDNVIDCCCRLRPSVLGTSSLYKRDKDYYLVLTDFKSDLFKNVFAASEYGEFVEVYPPWLIEHSKLIIEDTAVPDLRNL